jgi:HEAT repeat protein
MDMEQTFKKLKDKNIPDRWTHVLALEKFGQPAVDYLHSALNDEDKWVRYMAADALGNIGDVRSLDRLISLLDDQDQDVRFATAYALGNLGHPGAAPALENTCSKDNCFVKIAAEEALEKLSAAGPMPLTAESAKSANVK